MKKVISKLLMIAPVIASPIMMISCWNGGRSNIAKLNSSQIAEIESKIVFETTTKGSAKSLDELWNILKPTYDKYRANFTLAYLKSDKNLKQWIKLDYVNVNELYSGHYFNFGFKQDSATKLPTLIWEVGCSQYGIEGNGEIKLTII